MTAEIAIMNKTAIALAADSAATIPSQTPGKSHKIFNSANKLFSLSKYAPVGLMVYGNATVCGIPWETIIKMYRESLGEQRFSELHEYSEDFFKFLDTFDVPANQERRYVESIAWSITKNIRDELDSYVEDEAYSEKKVTSKQIGVKLKTIIDSKYQYFEKIAKKALHSESKRLKLCNEYRSLINNIKKSVFGNIFLTQLQESKLVAMTINAASVGPKQQSGIVIAGFGSKDLYPSFCSFDVAAIFAGKAIKGKTDSCNISDECPASITPFAQSDDIHTFIRGLGPDVSKFLDTEFRKTISEILPETIGDILKEKYNFQAARLKDMLSASTEVCRGLYDELISQLQSQIKARYINPMLTATGFLNKSELAEMAETLVNLVSFRKRVTMEAETVGGPIDVLLISKGDGNVWIKRKHYFPAELNHQFFSRYYSLD